MKDYLDGSDGAVFDASVKHYGLEAIWGSSFFDMSDAARAERVATRRAAAKAHYLQLLRDDPGRGGWDFREWAVKTALGLRASKGYTAQPTGGKNWQSWGRHE